MPRSSAMLEALTRLTSSSWPGEHAAQRGEREQAGVALGDPADVLDLDPVDGRRQGRGEPAEAADERQERVERLGVLGRDRGDVDRGGDDPAGEGGDHLLGGLDARAVLRLGGGGAEVRRDDDVGVAVEQRVVRDRLGREDVERRAGDLARVQRVLERRVVDELAARAVDHADAVAALRERLRVQEALRLRRAREVDGEEVGLGVDLGGGGRGLGAELAEALRADEGVVGDDAHAERLRPRRDQLADPAEAEHAQRLLIDLHPAEPRPLPPAGRQRRMRLRHVARQRQHQRDRVLRRRHDVRLRRIGHDDPALGRRRHVDVVHADPRAPDHAQPAGALDDVGGDLRRRADQQAVVVADAVGELLAREVEGHVDLEPLAQQVDPGVGDLLGDEDTAGFGEHGAQGTAVSPCDRAHGVPEPRSGRVGADRRRRPGTGPARAAGRRRAR